MKGHITTTQYLKQFKIKKVLRKLKILFWPQLSKINFQQLYYFVNVVVGRNNTLGSSLALRSGESSQFLGQLFYDLTQIADADWERGRGNGLKSLLKCQIENIELSPNYKYSLSMKKSESMQQQPTRLLTTCFPFVSRKYCTYVSNYIFICKSMKICRSRVTLVEAENPKPLYSLLFSFN